jgi:hypothetical protein
MSDFIWGLTTRDIGNAFWNGISQDAMIIGGATVTVVTGVIAHSILSSGKSSETQKQFCALAGMGAGIAVSLHYVDRLPYVTFAADKALKFFVISLVTGALGLKAGWAGAVVALTTSGGAFGYFGRDGLRFAGVIGAVLGGAVLSAWNGN